MPNLSLNDIADAHRDVEPATDYENSVSQRIAGLLAREKP